MFRDGGEQTSFGDGFERSDRGKGEERKGNGQGEACVQQAEMRLLLTDRRMS